MSSKPRQTSRHASGPRGVAMACVIACCAGAAPAAPAPDWVEEARKAPTPTLAADVPAVVLLAEEVLTVQDQGIVSRRLRHVVRLVTDEGRSAARMSFAYVPDSTRAHWARCWHCASGGACEERGGDDQVDVLADPQDVHGGVRKAIVDASGSVGPGSVVACEWSEVATQVFSQADWRFQARLPTLISRFVLVLPEGWTARSTTFGHEPVTPRVDGGTWTWEVRDLPYLRPEPLGPPVSRLAPWLGVSYMPPEGTTPESYVPMRSWAEVAAWLATLGDPRAEPDAAIRRRAAALTSQAANASARIAALAREVQDVPYVSEQLGLHRGGGYRPHDAADVFRSSHGDCKDKSTLLRAFLAAADVRSHLVSACVSDREQVKDAWPSPQQFDHAIVAIAAPDGVSGPAVVTHPSLGRLLFFDPTDATTPLGRLPPALQGSRVLVDGDPTGTLVELPRGADEDDRTERKAEGVLSKDGALRLHVHEIARGAIASAWRGVLRYASPEQRERIARLRFAGGSRDVVIQRLETTDLPDDDRVELDVEVLAPRHATQVGDMLALAPFLPLHVDAPDLECATRTQSIEPLGMVVEDIVKIELPAELRVDELPVAVGQDAELGQLTARCSLTGQALECRRSLLVHGRAVAASDCAKAQAFLDDVRRSDEVMAILVPR